MGIDSPLPGGDPPRGKGISSSGSWSAAWASCASTIWMAPCSSSTRLLRKVSASVRRTESGRISGASCHPPSKASSTPISNGCGRTARTVGSCASSPETEPNGSGCIGTSSTRSRGRCPRARPRLGCHRPHPCRASAPGERAALPTACRHGARPHLDVGSGWPLYVPQPRVARVHRSPGCGAG
jgi:hypothetical protein